MKRGPTVPPAGRRGTFSLKTEFLNRFWPQEWSGWARTGRRIHLVFVLGQTVDSGPDSDYPPTLVYQGNGRDRLLVETCLK